ncbi:hypothetical protein [Rhizobium leguminosarum]|uniref:hypothetical protein n=1 Tax=Rhizobium leguminosarum TaxID=384 RepID=UPI001C967B38|nr:hypothetical protein [Rhizobium leguminosarum]MBY5327189.1 hypothetical protein [Rhizobium leguminosarum]
MRKPVFIMQKISSHGTSNPIVARLGLQSIDLLKWVDISDRERDSASSLMFELHKKLLRCYDCLERLKENDRAAIDGTKNGFGNGAMAIPYLINLQDEVENFLTVAKQYLRDIVAPINKLYRANLNEDSSIFWDKGGLDSKAAAWAERNYGFEHRLTQMFLTDATWIAELVKRRNAMEHPGGKSGSLILQNYRVVGPTIASPGWRRDVNGQQGQSSLILPDLELALTRLLEFGEDIVAQCVLTRPIHEHFTIYETPPERRSPGNPARFKVGPDAFLLKSLAEAESAKEKPKEI